MSVQPTPRMNVDAFLAWADGREGKYELIGGEIVEMAPECVRHAEVKAAVSHMLRTAIRRNAMSCHVLIQGVAVRIDESTGYVPDALVYCGERADPEAMEISAPIIVVEVTSPSSRSIDVYRRLDGYFRLSSTAHCLFVDFSSQSVFHYRRGAGDAIETRILASGTIDLDPPGLTFAITDFFAES